MSVRVTGWEPQWAKNAEFRREMAKIQARARRAGRLTNWMKHIPYIGSVVHAFWYGLLDEGFWATCKPRWGLLTFAFLNDGMKPTLWHTWRQITHDNTDPFTGIYADGRGAPKSLAQAQEWERQWEAERLLKQGEEIHQRIASRFGQVGDA